MTNKITRYTIFTGLIILLLLSCGLSLSIGPVDIPLSEVWQNIFTFNQTSSQNSLIIWQIRIPRTILGILVGITLSLCGTSMQGLFRNPLADPGLIGISSGSALGAGIAIVLGSFISLPSLFEPYLLSICAFSLGGIVTWLVYRLGQQGGKTDVSTMLLAGIAITALSGAGIGLLTFIADDGMLRKLTFWNMGSLGGATYEVLCPILVVTILLCIILPRRADSLNALLLGESEAYSLGVNVERLKTELICFTALGVGTAVAVTGMIGFVGLVVPHLVRLIVGSNHRLVFPASALAGACLLLLADIAARVVFAPSELQIGIVTALLGAPFFLYLLIQRKV